MTSSKDNESTTTPSSSPPSDAAPAPSPKPPKGAPIWAILLVLILVVGAFAGGVVLGPRFSHGGGAPMRSVADSGGMAGMNMGGMNAAEDADSNAGMSGMDMPGMEGMESMSGMDMPGMKGMDAAEDADTDAGDASDHPTTDTQYYTCGMHPWVIMPEPGNCPVGGMQLVPLDPAKFSGDIAIDPVMTQNIGVRIEPVTSGPITRTIRTLGAIDFDETRLADISPKVGGWIEHLYIDFEGQEVHAGDPLFDLYSPELYAAQEEYLIALRSRGEVDAKASEDNERLIRDARTRLEFFDLTDEQIAKLERRGAPQRTIPILSPATGVVIERNATEGMRFEPGTRLYHVADLSTVWAVAAIYEHDLPSMRLGQPATLTLPYLPGVTFTGRVVYIYPYMDEKTRQGRVRFEFPNPDGLLKPGMFASLEMTTTLAAEGVLAPRSAVIDTGERAIAFVSLGGGHFEPRDVTLGIETGQGMVQILSGLKPGEQIVTSGQFLLDSESRLRESLAKMIRGESAIDQPAAVASADAPTSEPLPEPADAALTDALAAYFAVGDALASDSTDGIAPAAHRLNESMRALVQTEFPGTPLPWREHDEPATIGAEALSLADSADLPAARLAYARISIAMESLVRALGVPPSVDAEVQALHCPMFLEDQGGAEWLQRAGEVRNPFFGSAMLRCFDRRESIPLAGGAR